jgi:hypothetical protein
MGSCLHFFCLCCSLWAEILRRVELHPKSPTKYLKHSYFETLILNWNIHEGGGGGGGGGEEEEEERFLGLNRTVFLIALTP